jgi:hypothetical protein
MPKSLALRYALPFNGAQAAALQLKLDFVAGFWLLPGLRLGLSFQLHPCSVVIAGLSFALLGRDALCCLVRSG